MPKPQTYKAVVIGSGAGGAPAAATLAQHWGEGVAILEAGQHYTAKDFTQVEAQAMPKLYVGGGTQGTADGAIGVLQGSCVGGSTLINDAICFRPPPEIKKRWKKYGVELDFPHIKDYAQRIEQKMGVMPLRKDQINRNNYLLGLGAANLGWSGERLRHNSPACVQCGFRHLGCAYHAKLSMNTTFVPEATMLGAHLFPNTKVRHLEHKGRHWDVQTNNGTFRAQHVVLAAGVVQTPTILLRSGMDAGHDLQFHLQTIAWGDFADKVDMHNGIPMAYGVLEFADVNGHSGPGYMIEGVGVQPMAFAVQSSAEGKLKQEILKRYNYFSGSLSLLRSSARGRIEITTAGDPIINYTWNAHDAQRLQHFYQKITELYMAAGAQRVLLAHRKTRFVKKPPKLEDVPIGPNQQYLYTAHPFGGAGRGTTTDAVGRVKGQKNLWVLDASAFPEALGVNPQITIAALAVEGAERLLAGER